MQSEQTLSPVPTDSVTYLLAFIRRCLLNFMASDAPPIPQSNTDNDSSSAVNGTPFAGHHNSIDVISQHNPLRIIGSPSLHRAG